MTEVRDHGGESSDDRDAHWLPTTSLASWLIVALSRSSASAATPTSRSSRRSKGNAHHASSRRDTSRLPRTRRMASRGQRAGPESFVLHVGPGLTNATTGVATAAFDSVPMLVIAGDVPSYYEGRGPHQEFNLRRDADQVSVYEPFVKRAWRVRRARPGAAHPCPSVGPGDCRPARTSTRVDPDGHPCRAPGSERGWPASTVERPTLSATTASAIAEQLRSAERPVLLAGGGTRRAAAQVRRLAECAGLPVLHTLMGTGVLPPDHPQLVGMIGFWGSPAANRLASTADVLLAVGTRFPETDSSSWEHGVTFSIPPTRLHPGRPRSPRAGPQLPDVHRGHCRRCAGSGGDHRGVRCNRRPSAGTTGKRCVPNASSFWRRARANAIVRLSFRCFLNESWRTSGAPPRMPSS